jgi:hypothetical protein
MLASEQSQSGKAGASGRQATCPPQGDKNLSVERTTSKTCVARLADTNCRGHQGAGGVASFRAKEQKYESKAMHTSPSAARTIAQAELESNCPKAAQQMALGERYR